MSNRKDGGRYDESHSREPSRESEGCEVGETPEEGELVGARGRAGPDDEGGARDLQEEVETVDTRHQQADDDSDHCGDQSAT